MIPGRTPHPRFRLLLRTATTCMAAAVAIASHAAGPVSITLRTGGQGLDLDTGEIVDLQPRALAGRAATGVDIRAAYNARRQAHPVLLPVGPTVELAFLADTEFAAVTAGTGAQDLLDPRPPDRSLGQRDTLLVRTDRGSLYKVGHANEQDRTLTITYERLDQEELSQCDGC